MLSGRLAATVACMSLVAALLIPGPPPAAAEESPAPAGKKLPDENTIYIPYKELKEVFEKEGGGVFLPYSTFIKLWQKNRPPELEGLEQPDLPAAITAARYEGTAKEEAVTFSAEYQGHVFRKGWTAVPFAFRELAISKVHPGDGKSVLTSPGDGYVLMVPGPGQFSLKVDFIAKVKEQAGKRSFSFSTPAATRSRFEVVLPGRSLKVDLEPNLAATITDEPQDSTKVFAFLGAAERISVSWEPQIKKETAKKPLLSPVVHGSIRIEEGIVESVATLDYKIRQAPCDEFKVAFPAAYQLVKVDGPNIREWSDDEKAGNEKILKVTLHTPAKESFRFTVQIERIADTAGEVQVPCLRTVDTVREEGFLAIAVMPPLKAKVVKREGLSQMDLNEIPKEIKGQNTEFGFRYPKQPVALTMAVETMKPEIYAVVVSHVDIQEHLVVFRCETDFRVEKAGMFSVGFIIPKDYLPMQVGRPGLTGDWRVTKHEEGQALDIQLLAKTAGSFQIPFELSLKRDEIEGVFSLPFVKVVGAKNEKGFTAVTVAEGFSITTDEKSMVGFIPAEEEIRGMVFQNAFTAASLRNKSVSLGLKYLQHPLKAELTVEKLKSQVTASVRTLVDVKEDGIKVSHFIVYDIKRAAIREFQFSLPESVDPDKAEIKIADWEQTRKDAKKEKGRVHYDVLVHKKVQGAVTLAVTYELKMKDIAVGQRTAVEIPDIKVDDVFQWNGFIAVLKGNNVVVEEKEAAALDPKDPKELPDELRAAEPFMAYWFQSHPYSLTLDLIKYNYEEMVTTVISAMHVEAVLTGERELNCTAILEVKSKQAQFLRLKMPPGSRFLEDLTVDGQSVRASKTEKSQAENEYLVDLSRTKGKETEFHVIMRYAVSEAGRKSMGIMSSGYSIVLPAILAESGANAEMKPGTLWPPPVNRITLNLHCPTKYKYLSFSTEMIRLTRPTGVWQSIRDALLGAEEWRKREADALAAEIAALKQRAGVKSSGAETVERKTFSFYKTSAGAEVKMTYMHQNFFAFLDVLFLIAAIAVLVVLPHMKITGRAPALLGFASGCLLVSALSEALTPFAGTVFIATILSAVFWAGYFVWIDARRLFEKQRAARPQGPRGGPEIPGKPPEPTAPPAAPAGQASGAAPEAGESDQDSKSSKRKKARKPGKEGEEGPESPAEGR